MKHPSPVKPPIWLSFSFLAVYTLAALNPVYIDEVAYEYILGRYFKESGHNLFMVPECAGSFSLPVPFLWRIPRMILALGYGALPNLFALRAVGVLIALTNARLLFLILANSARPSMKDTVALFTLSLMVGTLPFLSIYARPEGCSYCWRLYQYISVSELCPTRLTQLPYPHEVSLRRSPS